MFNKNLVKLRRAAGLSQVDLARQVGVARATYINFEAGKSFPDLPQIKKLAEALQVPLTTLIQESPIVEPTNNVQLSNSAEEIKPREVVRENVEKLREALLYILDKIGAKPNIGETALYKLLYFIDFDYYEKTGKSITGLRYIKNHYGPSASITFKGVVEAMESHNELEIVETKFFGHKQKKYLPGIRPELKTLSADEVKHIDNELARLSDKTASELSSLSHRDMPWLATEDGQTIDYQLSMYRTTETSVKEPEDEL